MQSLMQAMGQVVLDDKLSPIVFNQYMRNKHSSERFITNMRNSPNDLYEVSTLEADSVCHNNYLEYLELCWAYHRTAVVTPDILWHIILCEFANIVAAEPERYRSLFTATKSGKQEILVGQEEGIILPLNAIVSELEQRVPTDTSLFLPEFSTQGEMERFVMYGAFADICSPYYNYSIFCCGIPRVEVRGYAEDYRILAHHVEKLGHLLKGQNASQKIMDWISRSSYTLRTLLNVLRPRVEFDYDVTDNRAEFFNNMFKLERCGSGSQHEVSGWITNLFLNQPDLPLVENFSTCVNLVKYKYLPTGIHYYMKLGLLSSKESGPVLEPKFGFMVYTDSQAMGV